MASEAQIQANRANALKSTGPRTAEGKAVVAQNAVRHGLLAEQQVIKGEDPGEFEFYREQMLGELHPAGALESVLAERAVGLAWRLRRAERLQNEVFDAMLVNDEVNPVQKLARSIAGQGPGTAGDGVSALGRVAAQDFGHGQVLYRLGMYERRIEHSFYRTLNELQKLRLLRELDEPEVHAVASAPEPPAPPEPEPPRQTKPIAPASGPKTVVRRENQGCEADPHDRNWGNGPRWRVGGDAGARRSAERRAGCQRPSRVYSTDLRSGGVADDVLQ